MRSQGISQFYLHTLRSSANTMNHTCLCLPSRSRYPFTDPGGGEGGRLRWLWYLLKCTFKVDFYENYLLHVVFSSFYAKGCQLETTTSKERSTVLGSKFESWSEGEDVGTMAKKVVTFRWVCILRIVYNTSFFIRTSVVNKMLSYRRETTLQGAL